MSVLHVVSVSGGKDSAATLLLALERFGSSRVVPVFCDTGNEHERTYAYLDHLEQALGVRIMRLRASFEDEIAAKRMFIARDTRHRREYQRVSKVDRAGRAVYRRHRDGSLVMVPVIDAKTGETVGQQPVQATGWNAGRKVRWTNKAKRRALAVLHPTGNAFLDLCLWKGRFPSRKAQFCTEQLKRDPAVSFQLGLIEAGHTVVSWQGVRRDESPNRRAATKFERLAPRLYAFRPLVDWSAAEVFAYCAGRSLQPNPLYLQGMSRVGCMPCINVNKAELREIAVRFPEHLQRIAEWEFKVSAASKRGGSTFMTESHAARDRRKVFADLHIWSRVQWATTRRGGRQYDLLASAEPSTACASAYGLCE
ncbi:phosphoadenosine phosphosulfate reductase family protein [Ideonella sp.]|uniref:phosphoadenosine phosphosulfate reductase domain-containing protein n=1 Tax=Ideonella sp. TaxID=1929293 RepID=UPI0035AF4D97